MASRPAFHLPGYQMRHEFRTEHGFLFITDYDCPMEEFTYFTLCDSNLRCISRRFFGWPYYSSYLDRVEWLDPQHLAAVFYQESPWLITIRPWGIPYLRPRLKVSRMKSPKKAQQATATKPDS